jgi:hypothetical protein
LELSTIELPSAPGIKATDGWLNGAL